MDERPRLPQVTDVGVHMSPCRRACSIQAWVDAIFAKQDSLGLKTWESYAEDARIGDTELMRQCAVRAGPFARIEAGLAFGTRIDPRGVATPTVLINGWRYPRVPSREDVDAAIDSVLSGLQPDTR